MKVFLPTIVAGEIEFLSRCSGELKNYGRYKFFSKAKDFERAKEKCMSLGEGWNLMIINTKRELTYLKEVLVDSCWENRAFWLGWKEFDTIAPGSRGRLETFFGKEPEWEPKWDRGEPNEEGQECVIYEGGKFHDTFCAESYAFTCEQHNFIEFCEPEAINPADFENYSIYAPENLEDGKNWNDARDYCLSKGAGWDLAVPNSEEEFELLVKGTNCSNKRFWLGAKYTANTDEIAVDDGIYDAVDGSTEKEIFRRWDTHTNWLSPPPHNRPGETECLRMRGNLMNTKDCETDGNKLPHGWICERN